jgi:hypothetical protein
MLGDRVGCGAKDGLRKEDEEKTHVMTELFVTEAVSKLRAGR